MKKWVIYLIIAIIVILTLVLLALASLLDLVWDSAKDWSIAPARENSYFQKKGPLDDYKNDFLNGDIDGLALSPKPK
jgi:hypothetical protein